MRQREKDQIRNRNIFLDTAEKLFAIKGYHNTSIGEIAAEAGFSKGALYNYFSGKEELLLGIFENKLEVFDLEEMTYRQDERSLRELLLEVVDRVFAFAIEHANFFLLFERSRLQVEEEFTSKMKPKIRSVLMMFGRQTAQIIEPHRNELRDDIPIEEISRAFSGMVTSAIIEQVIHFCEMSIEKGTDDFPPIQKPERARIIVNIFLDGALKQN